MNHCTTGDFGYLSDEIRDYSSHVSGLSDGTHYIHDNRLAIWADGAKNLEKRIAELEDEIANQNAELKDYARCLGVEAELEQELSQCLDVHAKLNDEKENLIKARDYDQHMFKDRIGELEQELESCAERARQWDMHNCTTHAMNLAEKNRRLRDALNEELPRLWDYYPNVARRLKKALEES